MIEILLTAIATFAGQFLKEKIWPKFGDAGIHIVIFLVAFVGAIVWYIALGNESVMMALTQAGKVLLLAIGFYEVVMKRVWFKSTDEMSLTRV